MNDDMQQWLQNVLGIQGTGLTGQQHQTDQGYGASTGYGDILGGSLNQMGGLAFQGQQQRNQDKAGLRNMILQACLVAAWGGQLAAAISCGKEIICQLTLPISQELRWSIMVLVTLSAKPFKVFRHKDCQE